MSTSTKASSWVGPAKSTHPAGFQSSPVDNLVSRLDGAKRTGHARYLAKCPAHEDRTASLSIRETDDGTVLLHCFAGCSVHEVVSAVGLELTDLFPPQSRDPEHLGKADRRPFPAVDILRAIAFEALIVAIVGTDILAGKALTVSERDRLHLAVSRIQAALDAGGLNRG
jgi:hypothetical protein